MSSLAGQVAIVTGGGDGIGGATARRLAEEGASVLIVEVTAKGEENAAAIRAAGGTAEAVVLDISKTADVKAMVATAVQKFGKLTILVNNAYGRLIVSALHQRFLYWQRVRQQAAPPLTSARPHCRYGAPPGVKLGGSAVDLDEDGWDYAFSVGIKSHYLVRHYLPMS